MTPTLDDNTEQLAAATRALMRRRAFKRAMENADMNSLLWPTEPISFAPVMECRSCQDPLYESSRSCVPGTCQECLEQSIALRSQQIAEAQRAVITAKSTKSFPYWVGMVAVAGVMLGLGAWYVPRFIGWAIFRLACG